MTGGDRWSRAQELFHEALSRTASDRTAYLERACGADAELRDEVLSLIDAHEHGGPLGPLEDEWEASPAPERIGPYRLVRRLGEGGMGTVYLAERAGQDFTQTVALKLIRAGFRDEHLEERLKAERRILARLEHPGIARLIDGGATPTGQPFVAMEYVEGIGLVDYCDRNRLGVVDRLRLFLDVCDALHYAHQQLVVHRDLKPSNILVTPEGRPKLLDFGIAKLLDPSEEHGGSTRSARWITPAYASPEQVRGQQVSTLTDVYALGVLLYELLTGRRPYEIETLSPAEVERVVCETIPERPSAVARDADLRGTTPERLRRALAGDLDTIALKALAKEPARRYTSVGVLADDVRRYLDGMPVLARPDSFGYRASKFVRRHKPSVLAAAVALLALLTGIATSAWQASLARRERDRAQQALQQSEDVTDYLVDLFASSDPSQGLVDTAAARALIERGLERAEELDAQPAVQARMFDALGEVQANLGRFVEADSLIQRALDIRRELHGPDDVEVAQSLDHLGTLRRRLGDYAVAESLYHRSLDIKRRALGLDHPELAVTLSLLGFLMPYVGEVEESVAFYRQALALRRRSLGTDHPLVGESMTTLGQALRNLGNYEEAEQVLREAVALQRRVRGPEHEQLAAAMLHLGDLLQRYRNQPDEAETLYRDALAILERRFGPESPRLAHPLGSLSELLEQRGEFAESERLLRRILAIRERTYGREHPAIAETLGGLATFLARRHRYAEAEDLARHALGLWVRTMGPTHQTVAGTTRALAVIVAERGRYREADSVIAEAERLRLAASGPLHPLLAISYVEHARIKRHLGDHDAALALLRQAEAIVRPQLPERHEHVQRVYREFVNLFDAWGREEEAADYRRRLVGQEPPPTGL